MEWSTERNVLRKLFVLSKNAHFYLMCRQPNLHKLARKFDARNLRKFLDCMSPRLYYNIPIPNYKLFRQH